MICVLKERDGWLYVMQVDTLSSSPEVIQRWFPTGERLLATVNLREYLT
jgi:hypothetical protein